MMDILALLQSFNPTHSNTNLRRNGRIVFALRDRVISLVSQTLPRDYRVTKTYSGVLDLKDCFRAS